jgi:hypothetical protein
VKPTHSLRLPFQCFHHLGMRLEPPCLSLAPRASASRTPSSPPSGWCAVWLRDGVDQWQDHCPLRSSSRTVPCTGMQSHCRQWSSCGVDGRGAVTSAHRISLEDFRPRPTLTLTSTSLCTPTSTGTDSMGGSPPVVAARTVVVSSPNSRHYKDFEKRRPSPHPLYMLRKQTFTTIAFAGTVCPTLAGCRSLNFMQRQLELECVEHCVHCSQSQCFSEPSHNKEHEQHTPHSRRRHKYLLTHTLKTLRGFLSQLWPAPTVCEAAGQWMCSARP